MGVLGTSIVIALLSGCASLETESGYQVQAKSASAIRQEPWHNVTIMGDIRSVETLAVAPFNLPEPFPIRWEEELLDEGRVYMAKQIDGKMVPKPLVRVVERALLYDEEGRLLELFDAVFFPDQMRFYVLLPSERAQALKGHQMVIVSSDGTWLMTGRKKIVKLPVGQDLQQLPSGFFREHPSELRQTFILERPDPILADLEWRFSERFSVQGVAYSGQRDALTILSKWTSLNSVTDRVISCGTFTVAPGMMPVSVAISLARNVYVASRADCLARKKD